MTASEPGERAKLLALSRRGLLTGTLAAACTRPKLGDSKLHLTFSAWGDASELGAFRNIIAAYEKLHADVRIDLQQISYEERHQVETLLAAGLGPDLLRVEYQEIGRFTSSNALIDLSRYLAPNLGAQYTAQTWAAVRYQDSIRALPHHTDTSAVLYNKAIFADLGIQAPQSLNDSWTWAQFIDVARAIKRVCPYGFAVNWTLGGSFRWLNFLYQRGGFLSGSGNTWRLGIPSQESLDTLRWTQAFFRNELVPPSDSATSSEQVENLFANRVVGMYFDVGPQAMREINPPFDWGTTFLPRDVRFASELGGNAVGVTRDCKHPAAAADFAVFLTNEQNMRDFVTAAQFLPVRRSLLEKPLEYPYRPDEMRVHLEQSKAVPLDLARLVTMPRFYRIERALGEELDRAFVGGQAAETTLVNLANEIRRSLGHG